MERGTDREREAVRERWAALEQNRRRADGLVAGLALCFAGAVLVLLASGTRICLAAQGLPGVPCDGARSRWPPRSRSRRSAASRSGRAGWRS